MGDRDWVSDVLFSLYISSIQIATEDSYCCGGKKEWAVKMKKSG